MDLYKKKKKIKETKQKIFERKLNRKEVIKIMLWIVWFPGR